jgi:hypothetical protein
MNILPLLLTMGLCLAFSLALFCWREHRSQPVRPLSRSGLPLDPAA